MKKDTSDLSLAFLDLIREEEHALSAGLPKMSQLNESVELQFLRYKLRLQVRMLLYEGYVGASGTDLSEADFSECEALIDRRPGILGVSPVVNTFWRQVKLIQDDPHQIELSSAQHLLAYQNTYESLFSLGEARDFFEGMAGFANHLVNNGRKEFSQLSFIMGLRAIELKFRGKKKANPEEYLSDAVYFNVVIIGVSQLHHDDVNKLLEVNDFGRRESIRTIREWFEAFINYYARFLDPLHRKKQQHYLRGVIYFHNEEYVELVKVYANLSIPNHDVANIIIKRCLFCASYSILYHGTAAERRMMRRRNLNLDLQVDRMRKHLEYLREGRPAVSKRLSATFEEFGELKKIYALRRTVEKGVMSASVKKKYLYEKSLVDPGKFKSAHSTKKWIERELSALP
ncbi:hypothetical protein [Neolewinella persica]|uniref:hypothetical protein n=1 Tax=Neolewinella persica TaxID=70998 RepID=UPI00037454F0|nr:hypothetical protein [Neolewinella persica]